MPRTAESNPFFDARLAPTAALLQAERAVALALDRHLITAVELDRGTADLLVRLMRAPGKRLKGVEIARALVINPSRTTRLIDRAEAAGLVRREPHPVDRRAQQIVLTDTGEEVAEGLAPRLIETLERIVFDEFTSEEAATLVGLLERLRDAARAVASQPDL